jgi:hypothetical protein
MREYHKQLLNLGLKEALVGKMDERQVQLAISYAMDHAQEKNMVQQLIQIISLDLRDKKGALLLASLGVANNLQLKNLHSNQVKGITEEWEAFQDEAQCRTLVREMIVENQQKLLFQKTDGAKGGEDYINVPSERREIY